MKLYDDNLSAVEDKATAGRLGGHSWNIISNSAKDEIYLQHVRSSDHYVNERGETTSAWFDRRRRIPHPLRGLEGANWSANVREILQCPSTPQRVLDADAVRLTFASYFL